jgi:hypothetical protein
MMRHVHALLLNQLALLGQHTQICVTHGRRLRTRSFTQSGALSCAVCFADTPAPGPRLSTAVVQCLQTHQPVETRTGRACQTACACCGRSQVCSLSLTSRTTTGASPLFNFTAFSAMACLNPTSAISAPSLVCDAKEWRQTHKKLGGFSPDPTVLLTHFQLR